jgi:hypothetical protein
VEEEVATTQLEHLVVLVAEDLRLGRPLEELEIELLELQHQHQHKVIMVEVDPPVLPIMVAAAVVVLVMSELTELLL